MWNRHDAVFQIVMTPIMTPPLACRGARALKVRGIGLAWGKALPRSQWRVAPTRTAHAAAPAHAQGSVPSTLAHHDVWTAPPHPRPRQDSKPALHRASRAARSARRLRHPHHQEATRARDRGEHVGARARSAHASERAARGRDRAAEGARARSAPICHLCRARSARRRWQPVWLPCLAQRARSAFGAYSAERGARDGDQARCTRPGAQRPRHRSRARSARRGAGRAGGAPLCTLSAV